MGLGSFLLGAVLGSTHTVEERTTHEIKYECPLTRRVYKQPAARIVKITIIPRFKSKEDIEEYFIGKPINEETMAELKAVLEDFDRRAR
jgi:hypothetical protein